MRILALFALDAQLHRFSIKSLLGFELRHNPDYTPSSQDAWDTPYFASAASRKPETPPQLRGLPRPE